MSTNQVFAAFLWCGLATTNSVTWAGGSEAGNGGGLSEKVLLFTYANLPHYIDLCLSTSRCSLSDEQSALLKKIRSDLPREISVPLDFHSEKATPGFFLIDGNVRVAKTGKVVGDPIYINSDLIYSKTEAGDYRALDVPLSASILVHELGHHEGVQDHEALDRLGTRLQILLMTHSEKSEFWNGNAAVSVFQLNSVRKDEDKSKIHEVDQLLLENGSEIYPLTDDVLTSLHCPGKKSQNKPIGVRLYNLHGKRGTRLYRKTQLLTRPMEGWYIISCTPGQESDHGDFEMNLIFKKIADQKFQFLPDRTQVKQVSCLVNKEACQ